VLRLAEDGSVRKMRIFDAAGPQQAGMDTTARGVTRATIGEIDYEANTVTLDEPCLTEGMIGRWVTVDTGRHVDAVRIDGIVSENVFSLGDQDLRCATGNVLAIQDGLQIEHDRVMYFVQPGMAVVNEEGRAVAHYASHEKNLIQLAETEISQAHFPDTDGDGRNRFVIMAIGPGNSIAIPDTFDYVAN
jgi:hypothetical protein